MKRILLLIFLIAASVNCLEAMQGEGTSTPLDLDVSYADDIPSAQTDLPNVRSKADSEKGALFQKMLDRFPLTKAIKQVKKTASPQVVLWFTNYFGSVSQETAEWYRDKVFDKVFKKVPKATFWLTDLKAWRFLSVDAQQLGINYKSIVEQIRQRPLAPKECPLVDKCSDVLDESISQNGAYESLSSQSFFQWMLRVKDMTLLPDGVANKLCKDSRRSDSLPYSLSRMGYKPPLLNRSLKRYEANEVSSNMLDVDFSLVYPVLQYLEGVYYAAKIIRFRAESFPEERPSLTFLLPNKEFAYYLVPGEEEPFATFKAAVERVLIQDNKPLPPSASIRFEPFAYGEDFYDAPYQLGGTRLKKNTFKALLAKSKALKGEDEV